jgi:hypothetical protein
MGAERDFEIFDSAARQLHVASSLATSAYVKELRPFYQKRGKLIVSYYRYFFTLCDAVNFAFLISDSRAYTAKLFYL